jgi:hypothetical protein
MTDIEEFKKLLSQIKDQAEENNYIIIHPGVYKVVEDYKNQNALQRFLWEIKWGFKDCLDNFRNWRGHMRGEEYWDFWEILNGEWSSYE